MRKPGAFRFFSHQSAAKAWTSQLVQLMMHQFMQDNISTIGSSVITIHVLPPKHMKEIRIGSPVIDDCKGYSLDN